MIQSMIHKLELLHSQYSKLIVWMCQSRRKDDAGKGLKAKQ